MIGVIGGYGAVGEHAVRMLSDAGPLKIGSRNADPSIDVRDPQSLARFVAGCSMVVNCAGPSHELSLRVAEAAFQAGADYVDAGDIVLDNVDTRGRRAVFSAGALPGLSGLLPRWMASKVGDAQRLTAYFGVFDRFTPTGAQDYLQGVLSPRNRPLGAWRTGPSSVVRQPRVALPLFADEVAAFPYLDEECVLLARDLGLVEGTWYSVVAGRHLETALDRARGLPLAEASSELCRASALDVAGRTPYVTFLVELDGHTCVVRAEGISELTGTVTGLAALAVLRGEVPAGAHRAAKVLDPALILHFGPTVLDGTIGELADAEEGVL